MIFHIFVLNIFSLNSKYNNFKSYILSWLFYRRFLFFPQMCPSSFVFIVVIEFSC